MAFERLVPGTFEWEMYYANHHSRYEFALANLKKYGTSKILDAATGVGYGANFLLMGGISNITAIDRDKSAIDIATKKFNANGINFLIDDCERFTITKNYFPFEAIVSFETLEHLPNPQFFLKNCHDALKENCHLIVSTPNRLVSSPDGIKKWEFHEKEYSPQELIELLQQSGFREIKIFGQQFTSIGKIRNQMRAEFNRLNFNPFIKFGELIQKTFRRRNFKAVLPEQIEDFEIMEYPDVNKIVEQGLKGPFVLVAICKK